MIRHIVLFKVAGETGEARASSLGTLTGALRPLIDVIPHLRSLRVDADTTGVDSHWDAVLVSEHASWDDLSAYQSHPHHVSAVGVINPVVADRAVVDVEI